MAERTRSSLPSLLLQLLVPARLLGASVTAQALLCASGTLEVPQLTPP